MWGKFSRFFRFYKRAVTLHSIHSPFLYQFIRSAFDLDRTYYPFLAIEGLREILGASEQKIGIQDFGAGSKTHDSSVRSIQSIVRSSSSGQNKCHLLFNTVHFFRPSCILELGTNLGLATLYMASTDPSTKVTTVEGDPSLFALAKAHFEKYNTNNNIIAVNATFEDFLNKAKRLDGYDLIYIDGHHSGEATLNYYRYFSGYDTNEKIVIIDDIHWSKDMEDAWRTIREDMCFGVSLDIFQMGFLFLMPRFKQVEHFNYIPYKYKPWKIGLFG